VRARLPLLGLISAAALALASPASAQFVLFSRCQTAYPCNQPFGLQYRPDPLIAGPWSNGSPASAVSAHIELKAPPSIELDKPKTPAMDDPVNNSVRYFLRKYPPVLTKPLKTTEPPAVDPADAAPKPPDSPDS
jgi:hypothetical protein